MLSFLKNKFPKFKSLDKIFLSYTPDNDLKSSTIFKDGHFTKMYTSGKFDGKNLANNLTSAPFILVKTQNNEDVKYFNNFYTTLNAVGQDKENSITSTYTSDLKNSKIKELPDSFVFNENQFSTNSLSLVISNRREKILYNDNNIFYENLDAPTSFEYAKDTKISVLRKFILIDDFEKINQDYLSTSQGEQDYTFLKMYLITLKNSPFFE